MPNESVATTKYWLALSLIKNLGSIKAQLLIKRFGNIESVFSASIAEIMSLNKLGPELAQEIIKAGQNIAKYEELIGQMSNCGIETICPESLDYPYLLNYIKDPPNILYKKGELPKSDYMAIAIVGTRYPTKRGSKIAEKIAEKLANNNIIVVSGLAKGIDTSAHRGALNCKGKTIGVIGSGLKKIYPDENLELAKEICYNGSIISECPPDETVSKGRLIQRNRITSGISLGVILIEPEQGAINTALWATKQKKRVFIYGLNNSQEIEKTIKKIIRIVDIDWIDILIEHLPSFKNSLLLGDSEDSFELF
ncbi:TPA: DNA-processing protein DprA [bacterium]|nr:DNA-processing protein DprA [bacterium]